MVNFLLGAAAGVVGFFIVLFVMAWLSLESQNKEFDEWKATLKKPPEEKDSNYDFE